MVKRHHWRCAWKCQTNGGEHKTSRGSLWFRWLKEAVFSMDPNSVASPDGFNEHFFQKAWDIVKNDIMEFVSAFFNGANLTKYYAQTCLVLILKISSPENFSQLRPISLCNFTNKIISKLIAMRINPLLPKIILENQTSFVKGRLITKNILLSIDCSWNQ